MGTALEQLPETGDWTVEVRSESAYIYGHTLARKNPAGLAVRGGLVDQFVAVLDQIIDHAFYAEWHADNESRDEWESVHSRTGYISFSGPVIAYGDNPGDWEHRAIELCYADIQALRDELTA